MDVLQVWLANIFQLLEGSLVVLVTGIGGVVLHKLAVKFHLNNEAELKAGLDYALEKGVRGAEGWADAKANAPTGSEKMDEAVKIARMFLTSPAFKGMADEQLKKLVEAALHQHINADAEVTPVVAPVVVATAPVK